MYRRESAEKAIEELNGKLVDVMNLVLMHESQKFTLKVEWARDNGRGGEFIKKRKYTKAKYCFECGVLDIYVILLLQETGHTSYKCPKNILGDRKKPKKKERKMEEESENVREWLNSYNDDMDDMFQLFCKLRFLVYLRHVIHIDK